MPNLRGPTEKKRRLYANALASVVLYGAPVWASSLTRSREGQGLYRAAQRVIAIRVGSFYRTVSFDAATVLTRFTPWYLVAQERFRLYVRLADAGALGPVGREETLEIRRQEALLTRRQ